MVKLTTNLVMNPRKMLSIHKLIALEILLLVLLSHCTNLRVHIVGSFPLKKIFLSFKLDFYSYNSMGKEAKKILYSSVKIYFECQIRFMFSYSGNSSSFSLSSLDSISSTSATSTYPLKQNLVPAMEPFFGLIWVDTGLIYTLHWQNPQPLAL